MVAWYWLGLRNKRLNNYNRFFLLFTLYASIQVPLLHFQWFPIRTSYAATVAPTSFLLHAINGGDANEQQAIPPHSFSYFNWYIIVSIIVITVSIGLLTTLFLRIAWIIRMSKRYPHTTKDGINFIPTNLAAAPFSFLNYLFWKNTIQMDTEGGELIFRHEITHIKERHTYDKLACQLLTCIFWFNPFYWLIQKELSMIHEFIADENAIHENDTEAFAKMLLQTHNNGSYLFPEHQFFSSPIKRRLIMLQTNAKTSHAMLRRIMVLPLAAGALLIFSFSPLKEKKTIVPADKKIVLVLDPGHGGTDIGAQYETSIEKDIDLKIANRIQELSAQYNIETHLTRTDDKTLSLQDRVALSNKLRPDDFISIHVADDPTPDQNKGDFDIAICFENPKVEQSKELGWAVYQHINAQGSVLKKTPTEKRAYVLRYNNAPSILIEFGDIKNKQQMQRITDDTKLDELCSAVLAGVVESHKK